MEESTIITPVKTKLSKEEKTKQYIGIANKIETKSQAMLSMIRSGFVIFIVLYIAWFVFKRYVLGG